MTLPPGSYATAPPSAAATAKRPRAAPSGHYGLTTVSVPFMPAASWPLTLQK